MKFFERSEGDRGNGDKSAMDAATHLLKAWAERRIGNGSGTPGKVDCFVSSDRVGPQSFSDPRDLMPLVVWHANEIYQTSIDKRGFGATFTPDPRASLGYLVGIKVKNASLSEMLLFLLEAAEDIWQFSPRAANQPTAIDVGPLATELRAKLSGTATKLDARTPATVSLGLPAGQ